MRIVILVRILWTAGAPKKALNQARALSELGHDVRVVFLRRSERVAGYLDLVDGVTVTVLHEANSSRLVPIYDFLTGVFAPDRRGDGRIDYNFLREFWKYLEKEPCELLICHDQYAGLAGYYSLKHLRIPYLVLLHERGDIPFPRALSLFTDIVEKRTLRNARAVLASTDKIGKTVWAKHRIRATTNYQGVVSRTFAPFAAREPALIAVSFWDRGRRPEVYLDLLDGLPQYKLYMVGNWRTDEEERRFRVELFKHPCRTRVILMKGISEDVLFNLYSKSRFVVRFGFGEFGESHAFFEGMENGVPVIVNEDLGTSELVKQYNLGTVIPTLKLETARDFIAKAGNQIAYSELQRNIGKFASEFTWRNHANALLRAAGALTSSNQNMGPVATSKGPALAQWTQ